MQDHAELVERLDYAYHVKLKKNKTDADMIRLLLEKIPSIKRGESYVAGDYDRVVSVTEPLTSIISSFTKPFICSARAYSSSDMAADS